MKLKKCSGSSLPYIIMWLAMSLVMILILSLINGEFNLLTVVLTCYVNACLVETWEELDAPKEGSKIFPICDDVELRRRELRKQNERQKDE